MTEKKLGEATGKSLLTIAREAKLRRHQEVPPLFPPETEEPKPADTKPKGKSEKAPPKAEPEFVVYQCGHKEAVKGFRGRVCRFCINKIRRKPRVNEVTRRDQRARRLPDGANFNVLYDAASMTWSGELSIPDGTETLTFRSQANGVFRLLEDLDRAYRDFLKRDRSNESDAVE